MKSPQKATTRRTSDLALPLVALAALTLWVCMGAFRGFIEDYGSAGLAAVVVVYLSVLLGFAVYLSHARRSHLLTVAVRSVSVPILIALALYPIEWFAGLLHFGCGFAG